MYCIPFNFNISRKRNKCYKMSYILNEFPTVFRCHIVGQFNEGLYDIIIAADEIALDAPADTKQNKGKHGKHRKLVY